MSDQPKKSNFFEKLATFIVDKRNLIFFLYAIAIIASLITQSWVKVCDDLTQYLPETTETRRGLTLMEDEMKTYGTARIIVSHVTYEIARDLADQIEDLNNISSVDFWDADKSADDTTLPSAANKTYEDYMQGADALITVTFRGENDDQSAKDGLAAVKELLAPYDTYISTDVGYSKSETLNEEMGIILVVAALVIVLVLLLTSRSYAEVPVLLLTFVAAALLNKGTNFIFGEISFVSDSVTVVLQLALAIDYSIILLHRFLEEREHAPDDRDGLHHRCQRRHSLYLRQQPDYHFRSGRHDVHAVPHRLRPGSGAHQGHPAEYAGRVHPDARTADALLQGDGADPPQELHPPDRPLGQAGLCPASCGRARIHRVRGGRLLPLQPVPLCVWLTTPS